jgi:hypothetical protein
MRLILLLAFALAPLPFAAPVQAQERMLTIYGNDKCPADTICVVGKESDRYRIPKLFRERLKTPQSTSWAVRSQSTLDVGRTGAESCSAVGGGGWTGCWAAEMRKARAEALAEKKGETIP